jgi:hypothetical protein
MCVCLPYTQGKSSLTDDGGESEKRMMWIIMCQKIVDQGILILLYGKGKNTVYQGGELFYFSLHSLLDEY